MTPLGLVVAGFLLVVWDVRLSGFDLLPDVVGWLVAALGLARLRVRSDWFTGALAAAAVGALLGLGAQVTEPQGALLVAQSVVETCLVFAVCSGVAEAVPADEGVVRTAHLVRWLDLGLVVLVAGVALLAPDPALLLVLGLATLGVLVWFLGLVYSIRDRPGLQGMAVAPA